MKSFGDAYVAIEQWCETPDYGSAKRGFRTAFCVFIFIAILGMVITGFVFVVLFATWYWTVVAAGAALIPFFLWLFS